MVATRHRSYEHPQTHQAGSASHVRHDNRKAIASLSPIPKQSTKTMNSIKATRTIGAKKRASTTEGTKATTCNKATMRKKAAKSTGVNAAVKKSTSVRKRTSVKSTKARRRGEDTRLIVEPPIIIEDKPFPFLELPPELRNRIYQYVFTAEGQDEDSTSLTTVHKSLIRGCRGNIMAIQTRTNYNIGLGEWIIRDASHQPRKTSDPSTLALLQTCRQIHSDAKIIPYHCNRLYFDTARSLFNFVTGTSTEKISAIQKITIMLRFVDLSIDNGYWQVLSLFPNLRSVRIVDDSISDFFTGEEGHSTYQSILKLRGLTDLHIVVVDESGRPARARTADLAWEKQRAQELKEVWKEAATRPKFLRCRQSLLYGD